MCPSATEKGKIHYLHEKKKKRKKATKSKWSNQMCLVY